MRRAVLILAAVTCGVALNGYLQPAHAATAPYQRIFTANFNGSLNRSIWTVYDGRPSCCTSLWSPSAVTTSGGVLTIDASQDPLTGQWTSGGISMGRSLNQTYGAWSFRFRMDPGVGVKMCALLWPEQGWPPEIDFAESSSSDANRQELSSTLHYGAGNTMIQHHLAVDYSTWHTMGVRWSPTRISYRIDGYRWATDTADIPDQPMHLGIQTTVGLSNGNGQMPDSSTPAHVGLHIAWVHVSRYTG
jgi:beta-glucanase (GH16 family)